MQQGAPRTLHEMVSDAHTTGHVLLENYELHQKTKVLAPVNNIALASIVRLAGCQIMCTADTC